MNLTNIQKCRWAVSNSLDEYMCVNTAVIDKVEIQECDCENCEYFYSQIDSENISYESGELLDA